MRAKTREQRRELEHLTVKPGRRESELEGMMAKADEQRPELEDMTAKADMQRPELEDMTAKADGQRPEREDMTAQKGGRGSELECMKIVLATSLRARLTGLLVSGCCASGEALLLVPCRSIHSFGMRQTLDIAFLDSNGSVLASERSLPPAKIRSHPHAVAVLERRSSPGYYWPEAGEQLTLSFQTPHLDTEGMREKHRGDFCIGEEDTAGRSSIHWTDKARWVRIPAEGNHNGTSRL